MKKYSLDKLKIILSDRIGEPEVTIKFKNVNSQYMIIKYKDYYTFQRLELMMIVEKYVLKVFIY